MRGAKQDEFATRNPGLVLYEMASSFATTSRTLLDDTGLELKDRQQLAEQYAASAVKLLKCAQNLAFFDNKPDNVKRLQKNEDLLRLKDRPDFRESQELLQLIKVK
jgi:hypothetical protein